jgi:alpha-N-acetylglucosamine transferase
MNAFFCVTSDSYAEPVEVLIKSIVANGHTEDIIVGHGKDLNKENQQRFNMLGAKTMSFPEIECPHCKPDHKRWNNNNVLKLHAFGLEEYSKILMIDADCMFVDNVSELFERKERYLFTKNNRKNADHFLAISGGAVVLTPNRTLYEELMKMASLPGINDGAWTTLEEGMLRAKFSNFTICQEWRKAHNTQQEVNGVGVMGQEYNLFYLKDEMLSDIPLIEKEKAKIIHFANWGFHQKPHVLPSDTFKLWKSQGFLTVLEYYEKYYQFRDDTHE